MKIDIYSHLIPPKLKDRYVSKTKNDTRIADEPEPV